MTEQSLRDERDRLRREMARASRDADTVTPEMRMEVMELLTMLGLPFVEAPMEAEAQCAALEAAGLVEGVVTDDSDAFLFGARNVYKNIFEDKKFVEEYRSSDVERELGLTRDDLIAMAMLLGSDYALGVDGIGEVNALEVLGTFGGLGGLARFREWVLNAKREEIESRTGGSAGGAKTDDGGDDTPELVKFKKSHKTSRQRWMVDDDFPSTAVVAAYTNPRVKDSRDVRLDWSKEPDVDGVRWLCSTRLQWRSDKIEREVVAAVREYRSRGPVQAPLERFITYDAKQRVAAIKSKRMARAVELIRRLRGGGEGQLAADDEVLAVDAEGKPVPLSSAVAAGGAKPSKKRAANANVKANVKGETKTTPTKRTKSAAATTKRGKAKAATSAKRRRRGAVVSSESSSSSSSSESSSSDSNEDSENEDDADDASEKSVTALDEP